MKQCSICSRALDQENDPLSLDCGGDCWGCVGEIEAEMGDETSREEVRGEIERGIRLAAVGRTGARTQPLSEQDRALFLEAWSDFSLGKGDKHVCNSCGTAIAFVERGSAISHFCSCGKFTGSLRGL
jgi:hypothetical protein